MMTHEAYLWLVMGLCCVGLLIRWAIKLADKADKEEREYRASKRAFEAEQRERFRQEEQYRRDHPDEFQNEQSALYDRNR